MKQEYIARVTIITVLTALMVVLIWGYFNTSTMLVLTGNMPENGGWQPGVIKAQAGEPLQLKLTSNDVVHGFAVGQMEGTETEVLPGKFTDLSITFHEPGTYTYYCTTWCGSNHWRMRGTIEVGEEKPSQDTSEKTPLYLQLGIDIDADHEVKVIPLSKPSAIRGGSFISVLPDKYLRPDYYFAYSPAEFFQKLRDEESLTNLGDEKIWDLVATIYWRNTTSEGLLAGQQIYNENCAACHGVSGQGDGIFAKAEDQLENPTSFSNAVQMLGANSALLQGKIIRGGMGTGMPYWGTIFTEDQTWSLVSYLWSFQFEYQLDK